MGSNISVLLKSIPRRQKDKLLRQIKTDRQTTYEMVRKNNLAIVL